MNWVRYVVLVLTFTTLLGAEDAVDISPESESETLTKAYEERLTGIEQLFLKRLNELREGYVNSVSRIEKDLARAGNPTQMLWTNRALRIAQASEQEWLALLAEEYEVPDPLENLNLGALAAVNSLRKKSLAELEATWERALNNFKALEKRQVQINKIDEAIQTRKQSEHIESSKLLPQIQKRISAFDSEIAAKKENKRADKIKWDPVPPPDAKFLFRKNNNAIQYIMKFAKIESGGFHASPTSRILLGNILNYTGRRGLAVVAINNGEILIEDTYDTYGFEEESIRMTEELKALPYGTFLFLAVRDDATRRFTGSADSTLRRFGAASGISNLPYRSSYIMIGVKGLPPGQAMEFEGMGRIRHDIPSN
jgi:hypothetical protein